MNSNACCSALKYHILGVVRGGVLEDTEVINLARSFTIGD